MNSIHAFRLRALRAWLQCLLFAGLAASQSVLAVGLSPDHSGQVLIYPYYTTRGENDTLISVVNHSAEAKALKLRVLEGEHGLAVLTANLYLAPTDVWTGSLTEENGQPALISNDQSCTVPDINLSSPALLDAQPLQSDSGRQSPDRLYEGFVEVIEMGTINLDGLGEATVPGPDNDCSIINSAWADDGVWTLDPQTDMGPPSGGLSGSAVIINVPGARAARYTATALDHFYVPVDGQELSLHTAPAELMPDLGQASPAISQLYIDDEFPPRLLEDQWPNGWLAVSAALMTASISADHESDQQINAATEWVITLPTMNALTQPDSGPIAPFTSTYGEPSAALGDNDHCEEFGYELRERNGWMVTIAPPIDPLPVGTFEAYLCASTNAIPINGAIPSRRQSPATNEAANISTAILASRLYTNIFTNGSESGWMVLNFNWNSPTQFDMPLRILTNNVSGRSYYGLPIVGFAYRAATNRTINALFGTAFDFRRDREITEAQ